MTLETVRAVFGWSALINIGVLSVWFLLFVTTHDWMLHLHQRWFQLSAQTFDTIHYAGMAWYKVSIWMFLVAPYLAMRLFM